MEEKKVLDSLQRLCSKAEYCSGDVRRKALKRLEGDQEAADRIVSALIKEKYVDDARYCAAFAREKTALQGWGPVKIRYMLKSKGIADSAISEGLQEIDEGSATKRMEKLLETKCRSLAGDPQGKLKLLKYALSRGYSYDDVADTVNRLWKGLPDES